MKREVHYCDACGTEMTWIDSDNDANVQCITVPEIKASGCIRESYGASWFAVLFHGKEFCSWGCFHASLIAFSKELETKTKDMERLK